MGKTRKPAKPIKPTASLQLVVSPTRTSLANLGINEAEADELRELIRSINKHEKKKEKPSDDGELPPAA